MLTFDFARIFQTLVEVGERVSLTSTQNRIFFAVWVPHVSELQCREIDLEDLWRALTLCNVLYHYDEGSLLIYHPIFAVTSIHLLSIHDARMVKICVKMIRNFPDACHVISLVVARLPIIFQRQRDNLDEVFPPPHIIDQIIAVLK